MLDAEANPSAALVDGERATRECASTVDKKADFGFSKGGCVRVHEIVTRLKGRQESYLVLQTFSYPSFNILARPVTAAQSYME